jgi:hypothetical protein
MKRTFLPDSSNHDIECTVEAFCDGAHVTVKRQQQTVAVIQYRIAGSTPSDITDGQMVLLTVLTQLFERFDAQRAPKVEEPLVEIA